VTAQQVMHALFGAVESSFLGHQSRSSTEQERPCATDSKRGVDLDLDQFTFTLTAKSMRGGM